MRAWMQTGPWVELTLLVSSLVLGVLIFSLYPRVLGALARRSSTDIDDMVVNSLRMPISASCPLLALLGVADIHWPSAKHWVGTVLVLLWGRGIAAVAGNMLSWLARHRDKYHTIVTVRTLPVFDLAARILVYGGTAYLVLVAWEVDVSGWLASAGIFGVVVGLASQETLSNLVAGVFVLADAPYKLGDMLVLDSGERGEVVDIGIRTTRLRNADGVEIIVPNKVMAGARVQNQTGVSGGLFRVKIPITVAYGSDLGLVERLLSETAGKDPLALASPPPEVHLKAATNIGLDYELYVWVNLPSQSGLVTHRVLTAIITKFYEMGADPVLPKPPPPYRIVARQEDPNTKTS